MKTLFVQLTTMRWRAAHRSMLTCHKQCTSDSDCAEPDTMCGCSPLDPAPRICVNLCFCSCD